MTPKQIAESLTEAQKRRLKRFECAWCLQDCYSAMVGSCGSIWDKCPRVTCIRRAADCLAASRTAHIADGAKTLRAVAQELEGGDG